MKWNEMEQNGMKCNGMEWNEMNGWNEWMNEILVYCLVMLGLLLGNARAHMWLIDSPNPYEFEQSWEWTYSHRT